MQCVPWTKAPVGEKSSPYFVKPLRRGCSCPKTQWHQSGQQRLCWPPRTASDTLAQSTSGSVFAALSASNSLPACPHAYFLWVLTQNSPLGYALPCPSLYFLSPFSASLFLLNTGHETRYIFYHLSDLSVFPPLKCNQAHKVIIDLML